VIAHQHTMQVLLGCRNGTFVANQCELLRSRTWWDLGHQGSVRIRAVRRKRGTTSAERFTVARAGELADMLL